MHTCVRGVSLCLHTAGEKSNVGEKAGGYRRLTGIFPPLIKSKFCLSRSLNNVKKALFLRIYNLFLLNIHISYSIKYTKKIIFLPVINFYL